MANRKSLSDCESTCGWYKARTRMYDDMVDECGRLESSHAELLEALTKILLEWDHLDPQDDAEAWKNFDDVLDEKRHLLKRATEEKQ